MYCENFNIKLKKYMKKHCPFLHIETLWDVYEREQLEELQAAAPRNGFEEMIVWTKQGKMWQFPIDNEQGINFYHQFY